MSGARLGDCSIDMAFNCERERDRELDGCELGGGKRGDSWAEWVRDGHDGVSDVRGRMVVVLDY